MGMPAGTCATSGSCGNYLVVEGNGSLYPCDFYCLDEWKLGVVKDTSFVEIMQCDKERRFLKDGAEHPAECNSCRWRRMCFGGCKRDWYVDSTGKHNYLCGAFQMFFEHSFPRIEQIAKQQKACLYWAFLDFLERPCIYWSCVMYYTKLKIGKRIIVQWYINGGARHDRCDLRPLFQW